MRVLENTLLIGNKPVIPLIIADQIRNGRIKTVAGEVCDLEIDIYVSDPVFCGKEDRTR